MKRLPLIVLITCWLATAYGQRAEMSLLKDRLPEVKTARDSINILNRLAMLSNLR